MNPLRSRNTPDESGKKLIPLDKLSSDSGPLSFQVDLLPGVVMNRRSYFTTFVLRYKCPKMPVLLASIAPLAARKGGCFSFPFTLPSKKQVLSVLYYISPWIACV